MATYREELGFVTSAPNEIFPAFLFNVMQNDFDDMYYEKSIVDDDMSAEIRGLKRRYSNFFEYSAAMSIYNEYMGWLVNKYGSMRIIKNSLKVGLFEDPVPAKPKLKMNRKNKALLKSGVTPSKRISTDINDEAIIALSRMMYPGQTGAEIDEADRFKKLDKATKKMFRRQYNQLAGVDRRKNLYRSSGIESGADFIIEYINQQTRGTYDEHGQYSEQSLLDIIREDERNELLPPELIEDELAGNTSKIVGGRFVNSREEQKMQIMKDLYSIGVDVIGNYGKSMNKQSVKMLRSNLGDVEPLSKKGRKKLKKRYKQDQKRIERRRDNDRILEKTLLQGKFDLDMSKDMINLRMRDLYRD